MEEAREKEEGGKFSLDLLPLYADTVESVGTMATPTKRRVSVQRTFICLLINFTALKFIYLQ